MKRNDSARFALGLPLATDKDPLRWALRTSALRALAKLPDEAARVAAAGGGGGAPTPRPRVRSAMLGLLHGRADLPPDVAFRVIGEALWDGSFTVPRRRRRALGAWPKSLADPLLAARGEIELDATVRQALAQPRHATPADG